MMETTLADTEAQTNLINMAADIVSAHVSHNTVAIGDLPGLIRSVHEALAKASAPAPVEGPAPEPAVSIRASIKHDYIVCLEDGKKLKMLKRYLRTRYDMSPEDYRAKWGLPSDYPMVAPSYAEQRKELAVKMGLGKKDGPTAKRVVAKAPAATEAPAKRSRPPKAAAPSKAAPMPAKRAKKVVTAK
jgi:predicted transcriptional regulator